MGGGVKATPRPLYLLERGPVLIVQEAERAQDWSGRVRKILPPPQRDSIPGSSSPFQVAIPLSYSDPRYSLSTVIKPRTYSMLLNDPQRIRPREKAKLNPDRAKDNSPTDCAGRLHSKYLRICFQVSRWRAGPSKRLFHTKLQLEREAEGGTQKTIVWIIYSSFIWKGWSYYIPMGVKNHINFRLAVEIPTLLTKVRDIRFKLLFLCCGSRNCLEVGKMQSADQLC